MTQSKLWDIYMQPDNLLIGVIEPQMKLPHIDR